MIEVFSFPKHLFSINNTIPKPTIHIIFPFTRNEIKILSIRLFQSSLKFTHQYSLLPFRSMDRLFVFHSIPRRTRFHCRSIEYFIADARDIYRPGQIKAHGNGYELLPLLYRLLVQTLIVAGHPIASTCVPAND